MRWAPATAGLTAALCLCAPAFAATDPRAFSIPSKPLSEALLDFAVQAGVSVGGEFCSARTRGVSGRMRPAEALTRLLAGSGCSYRVLDADAFRIVREPPPRPAVAAAPARPASEPARPPEPEDMPSSVVVTATRRELAEGRVSAGVSLVSRERLMVIGGRDERDAARQVSGVAMTNLGMGRDKIMIRGLSDGVFTGRTQSAVGTYLDQTPITYNAPDPDLYLADVERVEVLKGPQGALYGGGSLSGVLRIVTRQPQFGETSLFLRGGVASTKSGAMGRLTEGAANFALGDGAALRIVGYSELRGGTFDDPGQARPNADTTTRDGGRAALAVSLREGWRLTISGARQEIAADDAHYATESNTRRWRRLRPNRIAETHTNRFSQGSLFLEGTGDWGKLQSATTFVHHAFQSRYDASRAIGENEGGETVGLFDEPSRTQLWVQDANYLSPAGRRVQWLAGVFALRSREETNPLLTSFSPSTGARYRIYGQQRLDRRTEVAAYGEVSYTFARDWTLAVGGRAFRSTIKTRTNTIALGQPRSFDGEHSYSSFSPKVALSWAPPSGVLIYALVSQGYRAGGFNTGGFNPPTRLRQFAPDNLWNSEIGGKFDLLGGKLRIREALFYDIWSDIQTDQFDPDGLVFTYNVGEGRALGLEAEVRYQPTARLTLQANALLTHTKLSRIFNPVPANRESLPGAPRASFNSLVLWEKPIPDFGALQLGAEVGYVGRSHITFDRSPLPPSGGYFTSRLLMEFRTGRWTFGGYLDNPTNSAADTFAYGNPFSFGEVRQATPLRPRTFRATLTAEF